MKGNVTSRIWAKEIEPIIRFCEHNRGTVVKIHAAFEKAAKRKVNRQIVERWLHSDPKRRNEPLYGNGVLLIRVANSVIDSLKRSE
jgi:hypothetical protein